MFVYQVSPWAGVSVLLLQLPFPFLLFSFPPESQTQAPEDQEAGPAPGAAAERAGGGAEGTAGAAQQVTSATTCTQGHENR